MKISRRNAGVGNLRHESGPICRSAFGRLECSRFDRTGVLRLGGCGLEFADARTEPLLQSAYRHRTPVPAEGTLPHDGDSPTCIEELALRTVVPLDVALELGLPEVRLGGWRGCIAASRMAVPETAVNKANGAVATQDKIGLSGEIPDVEPESESAPMKRPSKGAFRFGVLSRYARHHSRPRGLVDDVSHGLRCSAIQTLRSGNLTRGSRQDQVSAQDTGDLRSSGTGFTSLFGIRQLQSERDIWHALEFVHLGVSLSLAGLIHGSANGGEARRS